MKGAIAHIFKDMPVLPADFPTDTIPGIGNNLAHLRGTEPAGKDRGIGVFDKEEGELAPLRLHVRTTGSD